MFVPSECQCLKIKLHGSSKPAPDPLVVGDAPLPIAGPGEIVIRNAAIAINPLDCHMQDPGVFVQQWPAIFGCDIAGEVYEVGKDVERFKEGDRIIGYVAFSRSNYPNLISILFRRHAINLTSGRPQDVRSLCIR